LIVVLGVALIHRASGSELHDERCPSLELSLPEGAGIHSLPPRVTLAEMIRRNRQLRQWFPAGLRRADERWAAKTTVEFQL